jgi:hypothetical protein
MPNIGRTQVFLNRVENNITKTSSYLADDLADEFKKNLKGELYLNRGIWRGHLRDSIRIERKGYGTRFIKFLKYGEGLQENRHPIFMSLGFNRYLAEGVLEKWIKDKTLGYDPSLPDAGQNMDMKKLRQKIIHTLMTKGTKRNLWINRAHKKTENYVHEKLPQAAKEYAQGGRYG